MPKKDVQNFERSVQAASHTSEVEDVETESDTGSLPDRLINPGEYEPVLPTTEHTAAELTKSQSMKTQEG